MQLPIIFVHEGKQKYLKDVIELAQKRNRLVYLIGDVDNQNYCKRWVDNQSLPTAAFKHFSEIYVHMSSNPYKFELSCFKRFYLLKEFMRLNKMEKCVLLDSDLCVYTTFDDEYYGKYDVSLAIPRDQDFFRWSASPHCSYWTYYALEKFISYCEEIYSKNIDILARKWEWHMKKNTRGGGVCDMTLLYLWVTNGNIECFNTNMIRNNIVFDFKYNSAESYNANEFLLDPVIGIKKILFNNNNAFFIAAETYQMVQALTVHCQGGNKKYIHLLTKEVNWRWCYLTIYLFSQTIICLKGFVKRVLRYKR